MCRSFSVALIVLFSLSASTAQDKRTLVAEVLQTARDFKQVAPVWHIISRQEDIFRFVPSVAPLKENYRISDRFGYRVHPVSGKRTFHAGLDMAAEYAATVHAAADGTVSFSGNVLRLWQNGCYNTPLRFQDTLCASYAYLQTQGCSGRER